MPHLRPIALLLALAVVSCTTASPGSAQKAPSPPAAPSASASATATPLEASPSASATASSPRRATPSPSATARTNPCAGKSGKVLVLVGAQLYDAATPGKPQLLCSIGGAQATRFASAKEISYVAADAPGTLLRLDFATGSHTSVELATGGRALGPYAWSPDGKNLAYWVLSVTTGQTGGAAQASQQAFLKIGAGAAKKLTEEMPVAIAPATYGDSLDVRWSSTGKYVAIVNTHINAPHLQVFQADGSSAFPSLGEEIRGAVAAAWGPSGDLLYIADQTALRTWAPPDTVTLFSDGQVFEPALCPAGCALAYTVRRPDSGQPKVHVLSLVAGNSDQNLRSGPVFVAPGRLWYFAEEPAPQDAALPYLRSGKLYEYDLQARLEVQLPVTGQSISDVWPRS